MRNREITHDPAEVAAYGGPGILAPLTVPSVENVTWIVPGPVTPCCLQLARIAFFSPSARRAAAALNVDSVAAGAVAVVGVEGGSLVRGGGLAVSVGGAGVVVDSVLIGSGVAEGGGVADGAAETAPSGTGGVALDTLVVALAELRPLDCGSE